jgi:hypothetical protein
MFYKLMLVSALTTASFAVAESDVKNGTIGTGTYTGTQGRQSYPGNATNDHVTVNRPEARDSVRTSASSTDRDKKKVSPGKGPGVGAPEGSRDTAQ